MSHTKHEMLLSPRVAGLSLVAYLDEPSRSASLVATLCGLSAELIGNPVVEVCETPPDDPQRISRQLLLSVNTNVDSLCMYYRARGLNRYRQYGMEEVNWLLCRSPWRRGHCETIPAIVCMTINLDTLGPEDVEKCSGIAKEFYGACQREGRLIHGVGDVADTYETCLGRYYSETGMSWIDPRRDLVRYLWNKAQARDKCVVRGIFWANYFGPAVVARMGGDAAALAREYAAMDFYEDSDLTRVYDDGSIVFLLTASPKWFKYPFNGIPHQTHERYAWLHHRLKAAQLLP